MKNTENSAPAAPAEVGDRRGLVVFFTLTFALTWGAAALVLSAPQLVERLGGKFSAHHPLFFWRYTPRPRRHLG